MRFLALLLLGPWLLILAWAYWAYPKSLPRTAWRRLFDTIALVLSGIAAAWLAMIGYDGYVAVQADEFGRHSGAIWQHVAPALYAYGGFSAVLLVAALLRALVWGRSRNERRQS
jgi:hypothetical protein